jgi:hypothetical protein
MPTSLTSPAGNPQPFPDAAYDRLLEARKIVDEHNINRDARAGLALSRAAL